MQIDSAAAALVNFWLVIDMCRALSGYSCTFLSIQNSVLLRDIRDTCRVQVLV